MSLHIQNEDIKSHRNRVMMMLPSIHSFELTRNALVIPFLQLLDLTEITAKTIKCSKKDKITPLSGERSIVMHGHQAIFMMETFHHKDSLTDFSFNFIKWAKRHKAKYAVLTNGLVYKFYLLKGLNSTKHRSALCEFKLTQTPIATIKRILDQCLNLGNSTN